MIYADAAASGALLLIDSDPPRYAEPHPAADTYTDDPRDRDRILAYCEEGCGLCGTAIATHARSVPREHAEDLTETGVPLDAIAAEVPDQGDPCPACALDIDLPAWIDVESLPISPDPDGRIYGDAIADLRGYLRDLAYGGCASGVYMPAVTYRDAADTMAQHGDDVLASLDEWAEWDGVLPPIPRGVSWDGIAVHYLSCAVESWGRGLLAELEGL